MSKNTIFFLFISFFLGKHGFSQEKLSPINGAWHGELSLNDRLHLPFEIMLNTTKNAPQLCILNGKNSTPLILKKHKKEEYYYRFSEFDSELCIRFNNNGKQLSGEWTNYNKTSPVSIPFTAYLSDETRFLIKGMPSYDFTGRWELVFADGNQPAIGLFEQKGNELTGTFLTETGDYGFLSGNVDENNTLYLSGFDGAHAYQFVANIGANNELNGLFYSGKNEPTLWSGKRNEQAVLRDSDSLTTLNNQKPFSFDALKLNGRPYHFSPKKNKAAIIQIMGSWCSNCIDETNYFKELYPRYKDKGIEFIAVAFEIGSPTQKRKRLKGFVKRCRVPYRVVLGGNKGAKEAQLIFSSLNTISSFPTTIFIDKQGRVRRIHTGFSGPGTGVEYINYKIATEKLLDEISRGD